MNTQNEQLVKLVRDIPALVLTGSRYFGTATAFSDWDFMLPSYAEHKLPSSFEKEAEFSKYDDPCIARVYKSYLLNCHVQIVYDHRMATKIRAQEILRSTGALLGVTDKYHARNIWKAVVIALQDGD